MNKVSDWGRLASKRDILCARLPGLWVLPEERTVALMKDNLRTKRELGH